jgi:hypothetical protein
MHTRIVLFTSIKTKAWFVSLKTLVFPTVLSLMTPGALYAIQYGFYMVEVEGSIGILRDSPVMPSYSIRRASTVAEELYGG